MITIYGVTEDGTSVPVQVTADGKLVAQGIQGPPGADGEDGKDSTVPGPEGPEGPPGEIQNGDSCQLLNILCRNIGVDEYVEVVNDHIVKLRPYAGDNASQILVNDSEGKTVFSVEGKGHMQAVSGAAGITADGEIYFTSRGTRYKLEVAGGLCNAIPYTREMELRERAEAQRKPRPTDSVPED